MREKVEQTIEKIRPAIQADGGDIRLHDVNEETGVVTVELQIATQKTEAVVKIALGVPQALAFFENPPVEIRLSTVTYLALLGMARSPAEQRRLRRFVAPYAVLSLGPMASSRAVELLLAHHLSDGLQPLQALMASTALAHEIPLYTRDPGPFLNIPAHVSVSDRSARSRTRSSAAVSPSGYSRSMARIR